MDASYVHSPELEALTTRQESRGCRRYDAILSGADTSNIFLAMGAIFVMGGERDIKFRGGLIMPGAWLAKTKKLLALAGRERGKKIFLSRGFCFFNFLLFFAGFLGLGGFFFFFLF